MQIRRSLDAYLALSRQINLEQGALRVLVSCMPGVDEEMRNWSFFMILEPNAIVIRKTSAQHVNRDDSTQTRTAG